MYQKRFCLTIYILMKMLACVCCIQDAIDVLKKEDEQQFLGDIETWDCVLGKGMNGQMFDLI